MRISQRALNKLKELENFEPNAYIPVPGDVPTIGYGFTRGVQMGDTMTRAEADARLVEEVAPYADTVQRACTVKPNQNEFDAMVLLCYNIGINGFRGSTVLKCHNRGDKQAAARAFGLWNKSGGKVYRGLTNRRAYEASLYLEPYSDSPLIRPHEPIIPQTVDPESTMPQSPINRASVIAGGTAGVATVAETLRTVRDAKDSAGGILDGLGSFGPWVVPVMLALVVGLCVYIVVQRNKQRKEGWA